jgi:catechol 1,2-dioxygenase
VASDFFNLRAKHRQNAPHLVRGACDDQNHRANRLVGLRLGGPVVQFQPHLRGVFRTNEAGEYWFRGVKPKYYPIPDDGPVGKLLGRLGRHPYRPAHLHYIIEAEGHERLVTHIFDPDDPYITSDAVFGVKESLMAKFVPVTDKARQAEAGFDGLFLEVVHDFVLAPDT